MREIEINITRGKLESFSVELGEEKAEVAGTVALYAGNKRITSFSISTKSWANPRFDLPPEMIDPIMDIAGQIEAIVIRECNKAMAQLPPIQEQ